MSSLSAISEELAEIEGQISDIFRALSNGFQKLDKVKDTNRRSRQLEDLTEKMRECKRLIKEFDREMKDSQYKFDSETTKQLNEKKQSMIKELNSYVAMKKQYASNIDNKRVDLLEGPSEGNAEENVMLASTMTNEQLMDHGNRRMDETDQAIDRAQKVVHETIDVGTTTAASLKGQTDQMGRIVNELDTINFSIKKASQLVKEIGRQVATDKCIMALLVLTVIGVIAIIVVKIVNPNNKDIRDIPGLAPPAPSRRFYQTRCRMSVRYLKKVLEEQEAPLQQQDSSDELESPESSAPSRNLFNLLDDDGEEYVHDEKLIWFSDEGEEAVLDDQPLRENADHQPSPTVNADSNVPSSSSNKSKKKKKKKSKIEKSTSSDYSDHLTSLKLENLAIGVNSTSREDVPSTANSKSAKGNGNYKKQFGSSVLHVDPKFLSAENELRRIFGSKVVDSFEKSHQAGSSRQARGVRRGSYSHRKTIIVSPSEHWPRWDGSLSMELLETKEGVHYFRYCIHQPMPKPREHSKLPRQFMISMGHCQLKFVHETNRPFFTTLFMHIKNMDRRGCNRSALEICKLLLSLDSDDPVGSMFCIDYYALRAEEYAWLERFSEEYNNDTSLWLFPNFSYSLAICRFYLETVEHPNNTEIDTGKASSSDLMKQALMLHPSVLKKSYLIWRLPDVQKILRDSALSVIKDLGDKEGDARDWACEEIALNSDKNGKYLQILYFSCFSCSVTVLLLFGYKAPSRYCVTKQVDPRRGAVAVDPRRGAIENFEQFPNQPIPINAPRDPANRNPLAVLLESILPWVDYGRAGEDFENGHNDHDNED
ncbi:hypothetical protein Leryth_010561 [Lithospermum erythrorhizon]|nr:hypothetical protein Leryth_010561 [Lithospermum erythrorhizon]